MSLFHTPPSYPAGPAMSNLREAETDEAVPPEPLPSPDEYQLLPLPLLASDYPAMPDCQPPYFFANQVSYFRHPDVGSTPKIKTKLPAYQDLYHHAGSGLQSQSQSSPWVAAQSMPFYSPPATLSREDYAVTLGVPPPPELDEPFSSACSSPDMSQAQAQLYRVAESSPLFDLPDLQGEEAQVQIEVEDSPLSKMSSLTEDDGGDDYVPSTPSTPDHYSHFHSPLRRSYFALHTRDYPESPPAPPNTYNGQPPPPPGEPPAVQGTGSKFARGFSKGRPESLPRGMWYQCANCAVTQTREWRRRKNQLLCNACGLYHAAHGRARPKEIQEAAAGRRATMLRNKKVVEPPIAPPKKIIRPRRSSKVILADPLYEITAQSKLLDRRARSRARDVNKLSMQPIRLQHAMQSSAPAPASAPAQTMGWTSHDLGSGYHTRAFKRRRTFDGSGAALNHHDIDVSPVYTPLATSPSGPSTPMAASSSLIWPSENQLTPHYMLPPNTMPSYFGSSQPPKSSALPSWNELAFASCPAEYSGWTPPN